MANSNTSDSDDGEHDESKNKIGNEVGNNQTGNENFDGFSNDNPDGLYGVYN